jgi:DNA-binding transcriptional regulator YbjK
MKRPSRRSAGRPPEPAGPTVRDRILAAAVELVRTEGVRNLTQARIAALAGVRQSHLTYYFPARKDLIRAAANAIHAGILEAMSTTVSTEVRRSTSRARAREFFAERISDPLFPRLSMALMVAAEEDKSLRRLLAEQDAALRDNLRETLARLDLTPSEDDLALLHAGFVGASILAAQAGTKTAAARAAHLARVGFDRLCNRAPPAPRKASGQPAGPRRR